ncbi:uncharacterized protein LOC134669874 [Cydia fagiglandana]|uniref:uncharacterized protein LOC134669874 n=1 Tax=Cydia fagiglandana TaxID=1458189 RepID=UPI002FEE65ED
MSSEQQVLMDTEAEDRRQLLTLPTGQRITLAEYKRIHQPRMRVPGAQPQPEESSKPQSAKMLIFLQNGEQRLITFTLPKESCTLQEVLEQVNVPVSEDTHVQCLQNTNSEIDYFVAVGSTSRIEDLLENHSYSVSLAQKREDWKVLGEAFAKGHTELAMENN